jgi:hypothetical protein
MSSINVSDLVPHPYKTKGKIRVLDNFCYRRTVQSDIHTVHSPTDAHLLELLLQFTLKLDGCYMFRSTTIIGELAIEPG